MFGGGTLYLVDIEGKVAHTWHMPHRPGLYGYLLDLLCLRPLPSEVVSRVQGGLPGTEANGAMYGDCLLEMTTSGDVVWAWRSWEHLDPATHRCPISDLLLN